MEFVRAISFLAACVVFLATGCGGQVMQVEGTVLFDGVPVESGSISFESADRNGRDFGGVIADGKYSVASPAGAEPGEMIVRIRATRKTGRKIPAGSPLPPGTMVDETVLAPKKYNDDSELKTTLQRGVVNQFDVKLVSGR